MTDSAIARITGMFGVSCVLLSWAQFPLWVIGGAPPFYDREALARHLSDIRTTAFIRILMDQGIYVSMMICHEVPSSAPFNADSDRDQQATYTRCRSDRVGLVNAG